ncbi:MAG: hypothetical protein CM15mV4_0080 [Caudoviricetes sp.]|nr:MAG: hypothetical protein CM15mV4_0080 [Caudoviricetes sp.]
MPNWCNNRVTISAGTVEEEEQLAEIVEIFKKDNPFQVLYPMPDFDKIPHPETGELPVAEEIKNPAGEVVHVSTRWKDGTQDTRWYDWRVQNWDTNGTSTKRMLNGVMKNLITSHSHLIQHGPT